MEHHQDGELDDVYDAVASNEQQNSEGDYQPMSESSRMINKTMEKGKSSILLPIFIA